MPNIQYNRDKVFAVATGALCGLIFCAGTALGGYHSMSELGAVAGLMSLSCYLICDLALIVASIVDYAEDDNPLEWAAWLIKGLLSLYLLFAGGCIAYVLLERNAAQASQEWRVEAARKAYDDCVANARTRGDKNRCNAHARAVQEVEASAARSLEAERRAGAGWVGDYIRWPLFKYLERVAQIRLKFRVLFNSVELKSTRSL